MKLLNQTLLEIEERPHTLVLAPTQELLARGGFEPKTKEEVTLRSQAYTTRVYRTPSVDGDISPSDKSSHGSDTELKETLSNPLSKEIHLKEVWYIPEQSKQNHAFSTKQQHQKHLGQFRETIYNP